MPKRGLSGCVPLRPMPRPSCGNGAASSRHPWLHALSACYTHGAVKVSSSQELHLLAAQDSKGCGPVRVCIQAPFLVLNVEAHPVALLQIRNSGVLSIDLDGRAFLQAEGDLRERLVLLVQEVNDRLLLVLALDFRRELGVWL